MEFDQVFNLVEGVFWLFIALVLLTQIRRFPRYRDLLIVASGAFVLFGITDFFEMYTRAWYRPMPLLLMNAACVTTLIACLLLYLRRKQGTNRKDPAWRSPS